MCHVVVDGGRRLKASVVIQQHAEHIGVNQAEAISTSLGSEVANLEQSLSELRRSCAEDVAANVKYALGPHLRQAEGYSGRGSFALRKAAVTVHLPDTNVLSAAGVRSA